MISFGGQILAVWLLVCSLFLAHTLGRKFKHHHRDRHHHHHHDFKDLDDLDNLDDFKDFDDSNDKLKSRAEEIGTTEQPSRTRPPPSTSRPPPSTSPPTSSRPDDQSDDHTNIPKTTTTTTTESPDGVENESSHGTSSPDKKAMTTERMLDHLNSRCGRSKSKAAQPRMHGGEPASDGQFGSFVYFKKPAGENSDQSETCGGVLIDDDLVLTVAHCLYSVEGDHHQSIEVSPTIRRHSRSKDLQPIKSSKICKSSGFDNITNGYDFAIIRLKKPFELDGNQASLACLPSRDTSKGKPVKVVSFGSSPAESSQPNSQELNPAATSGGQQEPIVKFARVRRQACPSGFNHATYICFGGPRSTGNLCKDDSGAPLYLTRRGVTEIVGLFSFSPEACGSSATKINIYSNLFGFMDHVLELAIECFN